MEQICEHNWKAGRGRELEILPDKIDKRKETLELRIIGLENELAELKVLIHRLQEKLDQL